MKNTSSFCLLFAFALCFCIGCGGNSKNDNGTKQNETTNSNELLEGKNLITQSDCLGCHKEDDKLVGPSYVEVANYYEANEENIKMLADKIVKGGQGSWGKVPMAPHPAISEQDAQKMTKYILSLKNR